MKITKLFLSLLIIGASLVITSCDSDDDNSYNDNSSGQTTTKISFPTFERDITTTTTDDVAMRCRFNNGGDNWYNMSCTVHWRKYSSKPTTTPKMSDMTNHESMRTYSTTTTSTTFDKAHAGFNGGTYIYYYFECSNSKYTTTTSMKHCIIKR